MKLRIVEVEGGKYAVQRKEFLERWEFLSLKEYYVWRPLDCIEKYCLGTLEEAEEAINIHIKELAMRKKKRPKVIKVIREVRV